MNHWERTRPGRLYASAVSRQLGDAGHRRSTWGEEGWQPGFRVEQQGDDVIVFCEGPLGPVDPAAEAAQLDHYALVLRNLGYHVQPEAGPTLEDRGHPARAKLLVARTAPGMRYDDAS